MIYPHPLCSMSIGSPILRYSYLKIWPWKSLVNTMRMIKGLGHIWPWKFTDQGHCQGQTWWLHLRPKVQSICLLFVSWHNRTILCWDIANSMFDLVNSRSRSWPKSNQVVTFEAQSSIDMFVFLFRGNRNIFGWDIANPIFDLENWRSRSRKKSNKI